jgi:hypothetical protein
MQNPFDENQSSARPTFLTVLCILTFAWNAYKFYGGIPNTFTPEKVMANKEKANEMMTDMFSKYMSEKDLEQIEKSQEATAQLFEERNLVLSGGMTMISSLLLLLGAFWMWNLQKRGFWVYLAGNAVGILAPIFIVGGQIGWTFGIVSFIASAIFTGLYAMNLKYLA